MEDTILITQLNDFIFCPVSIYFHNLYGSMDTMFFQSAFQLNGTHAHKAVDEGHYSTKKSILTGLDVYCEHYKLIGKIDMFDKDKGVLTERKRLVKQIYDGYVFQLYAQYFSLMEMGYEVNTLQIYSMADNKTYLIAKPTDDQEMFGKFEKTISDIRSFNMATFEQSNRAKCERCIYEPACDRGML